MVKTVIVKLGTSGTKGIKKVVEAKHDCNIEYLNTAEEIHCWERMLDVKDETSKSKTVRLQYTRPRWMPAEARDIPRIIYEETIDGWEFSGMTNEATTRKLKFIKPD